MTKRKATVVQKDMSLGAVRADAIERDDTELQNRSVQTALNTTILSTGVLDQRPGSFYLRTVASDNGIEIEPASGVIYALLLVDGGLQIHDENASLVASFATATWTLAEKPWMLDLGDTVLIGSQTSDIHALTYEDGLFSFGLLAWAEGVGDALNQPYWSFETGMTLQPSARTGSVTLTTSADFFSAAYIGERIRYGEREIEITAVTDAQNATGTVKTELPPTKVLTVASTSGFQIGEAVEHATLGGQGVITDITGSNITVFVTRFFTGFDGTGANLVGPNAKANISAHANGTPAAVALWDEPLISAVRGYPGGAEEHEGRVIFNDFPQAPNAVALSSTGTINDFLVGTNDDDAIVDTITASKATRILHVVSVEDLLFLTSNGVFYQQTRDGSKLSPDTFAPVRFDSVGASAVRPAKVHDAVIFSASNGKNIFAAILQGDIYKAWSLTPLSDFHNHLITGPVRITATENDSDRPERFAFVVNSDGTAAVMRWERGPQFPSDTVGWVPWVTTGSYKALFMAFGKIHSLVQRTVSGTAYTFYERMDQDAQLDSATGFDGTIYTTLVDENGDALVDENGDVLVALTNTASHLVGETVSAWSNDFDLGTYALNSDGAPVDDDGNVVALSSVDVQIGLPFTVTIQPWSKRSQEGYGTRREAQRIIRLTVMVQNTIKFDMNGEPFGGHRAGDDLSLPPPRRTEHAHFYPGTRDPYQDMIISKTRPGPFRLTGMSFKVQL